MDDKYQNVQKYFNQTDTYLNNNLVISLRSKLIVNNLPEIENKEIIDIGCGNGEITLPFIYNNKITFLDISINMLDLVLKKIPSGYLKNAELVNKDFGSFNTEKKYDYLFLIGVLAHVESISKTISKLSELSKDDGNIILQYTNSYNIISIILRITGSFKKIMGIKYGYKINLISTIELNKILSIYNLECIKRISYWPALPGFKLIPKCIRKYFYFKILNGNILHALGGEKILVIKPA